MKEVRGLFESMLTGVVKVYNKPRDKWQEFDWCLVSDEGYLLHTPPGQNNFFVADADGFWTGEFVQNIPENKSNALLYNQLAVEMVHAPIVSV